MNLRGLFHLFVVYIVWGSTYMAIRVAVREGAGFPPFIMAAMRFSLAAVILFAWAVIARKKLRITARQTGQLFVVGILLFVGGNGLVTYAEQRAESGYAALLVASLPIWVAIMEAIIDRRRPSFRLVAALLVGLSGVAVLNGPVFRHGTMDDLVSAIALTWAPILWGIGSLLQQRRPVKLSPEVLSAYQQMLGSVGLLIVAFAMREPVPAPIPEAWTAWGYLVIFGSVFAFTSFIKALQMLPTSVVMTYAYVNPVVAIFLGWLLLSEAVTLWTLAGTVLILAGVVGVFQEKRGRKTGETTSTLQTARTDAE